MTQSAALSTIVNAVSIETAQGYKTFYLVQGDITQVPTDLLICSTHAVRHARSYGDVLDVLISKHRINPAECAQWLLFAPGLWTSFAESVEDGACFSSLLIAFISGIADYNEALYEDPLVYFASAVQCIFASIAALEYTGRKFPTISLPMISGNRIHNEHYAGAIEALIRHALQWLKKSDHTHTVKFVVYDEQQLPGWDAAMNKTMGRSLISSCSDNVLSSLCQEIVAWIHAHSDERLAGAIQPLRSALSHPNRLYIETVCVWGRKLVEAMVAVLLAALDVKASPNLASNIEALSQSKATAPWIISYMHALRIFGNESVHAKSEGSAYTPPHLTERDLVSALSAVRSLLAIWPELSQVTRAD